eukprot:CAMPEP_0114265920 /NCGR_PEP_ID=MMETSP0058-20121206/24265_1 /TAXON_ID=36894 /ORGANISM="Pyramimonas parkeae, CCMP726" /LENGTH=38 /DNA_ID= /DNA_START= /DNA_END= /DNA_ORIENTATION=
MSSSSYWICIGVTVRGASGLQVLACKGFEMPPRAIPAP